jgi:GABA(A) receptor-associated protein
MWKYIFNKPKASRSTYEFKMMHSFEKRKEEGERLRNKYPNKIPIIVEKSDRSDIPEIEKKTYLVPEDITVGQFMYILRKNIKLDPVQAMFLFINNKTIPATEGSIKDLYKDYADKDNFLYVTYTGENTFGCGA